MTGSMFHADRITTVGVVPALIAPDGEGGGHENDQAGGRRLAAVWRDMGNRAGERRAGGAGSPTSQSRNAFASSRTQVQVSEAEAGGRGKFFTRRLVIPMVHREWMSRDTVSPESWSSRYERDERPTKARVAL